MEYDAIVEHLPREGIISKYMELTQGGEVCPRFRFFTIAAAIGALVNRKVWLQRGSKETFPTLYPNPWVILIAPQGKGHKSSSIRVVRRMLEVLPSEKKPRIMSAKVTPEAFVKALSTSIINEQKVPEHMVQLIRKKAIGCLISSELGVLLGREKYLTGMAVLLTDLYDCPDIWNSETIMRGDERLYDVCLSLLAACTPDWMQTLLPKDAFEIGFMSRLVLVPLPRGWQVRKIPYAASKALYDEIINEFIVLANIKGEMLLEDETWRTYKEWYLNLPNPPPGPRSEYLERKQDHILRIAMILQIAQTRKLILEPRFYTQALNILGSIEPEVMELIDYISMEPKMRIVKRILEKIEFEGEILEGELLTECLNKLSYIREFSEVMQLLLQTKQVEMEITSKGTLYRKRKKEKI